MEEEGHIGKREYKLEFRRRILPKDLAQGWHSWLKWQGSGLLQTDKLHCRCRSQLGFSIESHEVSDVEKKEEKEEESHEVSDVAPQASTESQVQSMDTSPGGAATTTASW